MARGDLPPHEIADPALSDAGQARIDWAAAQMPVLGSIGARFSEQRPLDGLRVAACLHVTAETANLMGTLRAGGAQVALCASNPLSTQDDTASALVRRHGVSVRAVHGEGPRAYAEHLRELARWGPDVAIDDGADLIAALHEDRQRRSTGKGQGARRPLGATEETTIGLVRARAMHAEGTLAFPVLAVNESHSERTFNDRFGTGQSTVDGILRATNVLLAGRTVVVIGYGFTGRGVALRARGAGAHVIVCEVDPVHALEARMEGFEVMPALDAAERGEVFITVTGARDVLRREHFERMKDGAILANAGHFDVEINLDDLRSAAISPAREVRPLVAQYELPDRRLNLLAEGRVVNLTAAEGHPAAVMDISFALQALCAEDLVRRGGELEVGVLAVPTGIDHEVARLKLESLEVRIDELSEAQREYLRSWEGGSTGEPIR
ncbi:MAG: adenosylhomocysteinase [Actinobacteria bacterium]|nr:MAG: adenosylhomocysteinase [Actinomycetota bacterium]